MFYSVIVPVYNSEEYLRQCLDSIVSQSFSDIELILINDGSEDSSLSICEEYKKRFSFIRLISYENNKGASAARNIGLENAKGDYIVCVDNDDWLYQKTSLESLYNFIISNGYPDIVCHALAQFYPNEKKTVLSTLKKENSSTSHPYDLHTLLSNNMYASSVVAKCIKRSLLVQKGVRFNESIHHNEDTDFSRRLLYYTNSIVWFNSPIYVWRRSSSVSQSSSPIDDSVLRDLDTIFSEHDQAALVVNPSFYENSTIFLSYLFVIYISYLYMVKTEFSAEKRLGIKNRISYFKHSSNKRVKLASVFIRLFGINLTGHLLAWVMMRERRRISNV